MDRALLDTDTYSEVVRERNARVANRASAYLQEFGRFTLSVVTVSEVVAGLSRMGYAQRLQDFLAFLARTDVLPLD